MEFYTTIKNYVIKYIGKWIEKEKKLRMNYPRLERQICIQLYVTINC